MGLFVQVWGDRKHTSRTLLDAADVARPLRFTDYHNWTDDSAKRKLPLPVVHIGDDPKLIVEIQPCTVDGTPAKHFFHDGRYWFAFETPEVQRTNPGCCVLVHHQDKSRLKLFCELEYGEVLW